LAHVPATLRASEVRSGTTPRVRYRLDFTSTYTFAPGTHCDLAVTNTFVETFTDTSEAIRALDPPQVYALDDGSASNVYSPAFTQSTYARSHVADRLAERAGIRTRGITGSSIISTASISHVCASYA